MDDPQAEDALSQLELEVRCNLLTAHRIIQARVYSSIAARYGNAQRVGTDRRDVLYFVERLDAQRRLFTLDEISRLSDSCKLMVASLDDAGGDLYDPQDTDTVVIVSETLTGKRGRPRKNIDIGLLTQALQFRGPSGIGRSFNCSARTVRRRIVEAGLSPAAAAPFSQEIQVDSVTGERLPARTSRPLSEMSDAELDALVRSILVSFPDLGRSLIDGALKSEGHHVPIDRVRQSIERIRGVSGRFGLRTIHRRKYNVPGPLSLVHHDGQHGLIRYRMPIHCFIDGFSRFVLAIQVSDNNRGSTVLRLFVDKACHLGVPSRVRGDHGTENIETARWMEEHRGQGRGSYIWGRSVHNTRIERLWYDVTQGFGMKWKTFFMLLETSNELDAHRADHLWLLHYLFLSCVNEDAQEWARTWNNHKMQLSGETNKSPREMMFFGMIERGIRGSAPLQGQLENLNGVHMDGTVEADFRGVHLDVPDEVVEDLTEYGVDWEDHDDIPRMQHLLENNPHELQWRGNNALAPPTMPARLSNVQCESPDGDCPLTHEEITRLEQELIDRQINRHETKSMEVRRLVWNEALDIYYAIVELRATGSEPTTEG